MWATPLLAVLLGAQVVHVSTTPPSVRVHSISMIVNNVPATLEFSLQDDHVELVDAFTHKHKLDADARMKIFHAMLEEGLAHNPSYLSDLRTKRLRPSRAGTCSLPDGSPLPAGFLLYHAATTNSTPSDNDPAASNSGASNSENKERTRDDIAAVDTVWEELNAIALAHEPSALPQWHVRPVQVVSILDALDELNADNSGQLQTYCEVGFMMGHSAAAVLVSRPHVRVLSFDFYNWTYSDAVVELFEARWGDRFTSVTGTSVRTIPEFHASNPEFRCDVVFVDGGHIGPTVLSDAVHMRKLVNVHAPHVVFFDDSMQDWEQDTRYMFNTILDCGTDVSVHFVASSVEQTLRLGEEISLLRSVKTHQYPPAHPCNPMFYDVCLPWAWSEARYSPEFNPCNITNTKKALLRLLPVRFRALIFSECEDGS